MGALESIKTSIGRFRLVAVSEGVSFLLILFVTMPLKYGMGIPEPNLVVGMAHGILFVAYVLMVIQLKIEEDWSFLKMFWALVASVVPFGTFYFTKKMLD